jgi:GNAT superfamily N-acetyltransferase
MKGVTVRRYRPEDEVEIVSLLMQVFDGWPHLSMGCAPLDHWRWKYRDNPRGPGFVVVAVSGGEIIGCNHAFPVMIRIGDDVHLCGFSADTVVHPDFRGRGLYNEMRDEKRRMVLEAGVAMNFLVSSNPIVLEDHYRKNHPGFPHRISNLIRIKDVDLHLVAMPVGGSGRMRFGFHVVRLLNEVGNTFREFRRAEEVDIREIKCFNEDSDSFLEKISGHYDFIVERSRDYLNWRYCDPRSGGFTVKLAESHDGDVLGYTVLKINEYIKDYPIGYLVDLLSLPDRLDVASNLVESSTGFFDERNVNVVSCQAVKDHPVKQVLNKHGFLDSRIRFHLLYRPFNQLYKLKRFVDFYPSKTHFSYGDVDSLPVRMPSY